MTGYTNTPILPEKAKELMSLDTEYKEIITYGKIEEWFTAWDGKVYVSFSGGKDSTVLAYLAANGLWKPNEKGLGYGRVLDYIGVRY